MTLFVFDDARADAWEPFSLTRPCAELRFGAFLLRERLERFADVEASATLSRPWLAGFAEPGAPPCLARDPVPAPGGGLWLASRFVPDADARPPAAAARVPRVLLCGGEVAGLQLPAGHDTPEAAWLARPDAVPGAEEVEVAGHMLPHAWSLVEGNADRLERDLRDAPRAPARVPDHVHVLGDGPLRLGKDVRIEPGVLLDLRRGGIRLDDGTEILAGSRLEGPLHVGPHGRVLGGPLARVSAGPFSYLRGEIEESVVLGYANKAHDGFLGHAYLGRWVNLGAGTTNSDLKNNYGPVRVGGPGGDVDSGLLKLGCLLGDHVRTAIGTLLNTGTVVGAGANVFGPASPPKWVPPFAWGHDAGPVTYRLERFLETAATAMPRRGQPLDEPARRCLSAAWDEARRRHGA